MRVADYHEQFAAAYDTFYVKRDVAGEVQLAVNLLGLDNAPAGSRHVLDFGCGTGSHVLAFAARGFKATGFDRSPAMIAQARAKCSARGFADVTFESGAAGEFFSRLDGTRFDGAVSFFNVLNCIETPGDMTSQLQLIRSRLTPGARMLIEVWNGAAVFRDAPRPDVRLCADPDSPARELVRMTLPAIDHISQKCTLLYRVLDLNREAGSFAEFNSVHDIQFLTPVHYRHLFELADLTILDEFPKGRPGTPITQDDWHISYLVRRDA